MLPPTDTRERRDVDLIDLDREARELCSGQVRGYAERERAGR